MAYVTVPKDLTKIKSKMLFGLTKRQLVFRIGGAYWSAAFLFEQGQYGHDAGGAVYDPCDAALFPVCPV